MKARRVDDGCESTDGTLLLREAAMRQEIFRKFVERMRKMKGGEDDAAYRELNPDIIVISGDQSLLFEPQNEHAAELLRQRCGLCDADTQTRERVRVHPCEGRKIIADLTMAGLKIAC